jgi:hypothetical protein
MSEKKIYEKCRIRTLFFNSTLDKTKFFLTQYKRSISIGLFGVTIATLIDRIYLNKNSTTLTNKRDIILPPVRAFVGNMTVIKENAMAIVFSLSSTAGGLTDSFYKGFRDTLIKNVLDLAHNIKEITDGCKK